ncbi:hypothetical protein PIB30_043125 [Stylosanthes scabra]|uniref:Uncharacterized protein n=1 Tax=Stylosanthes scabra TaxID=79078 RepID=A0ABU6WFF3_9FABA|nr:hypothetical protein [Stylosanthes scabra]
MVSGLSLQKSSSGSDSFSLSLAWLAAALSSSTSSHAATHSPLAGSSEHVSCAFFILSATFSDILSGAVLTGLTLTKRPDPVMPAGNLTRWRLRGDPDDDALKSKRPGVERLRPEIVAMLLLLLLLSFPSWSLFCSC